MIKTNELRIGNWVKDIWQSVPGIIELTPFEFKLRVINHNCDKLEPIPLTPEILESCGFELDENKVRYGKAYYTPNDILSLYLMEHIHGFWIILENINLGTINNLHQLQNLFFALAGEELKVKLNVETNQ